METINMKTILFTGDSITDVGRSRENNNNLGHGYPTLVTAALGFEFPNQYKMFNRGISGNRIVDLYARVKMDCINLEPDVMSILIGVNDVWHEFDYNNGVEPEKFFNVYSMMIEEIKTALPNIKIMIMEPFVLNGPATVVNWNQFYSEVRLRAEKAKAIAKKYDLVYIPLQEKFDAAAKIAPNTFWLEDGVHPTTAGHELIKREWLNAFLQEDR